MTDKRESTDSAATRAAQEREDFRSYALGLGLALLLTCVPFAMVHWHLVPRRALFMTIGGCALVQIVAHFRFFLHIGWKRQREDLQLILFSALIMAIMVAGTLWIMGSLSVRMAMPGMS
ncbi:MAG: cytochrome o ubiquinol oxidase subunit IV [Janthinobacterium lividum]